MAVAADVPNKFDLVINGQGYMLDRSYDDSPYRKPPAAYSYTPTFLERTNVGSGYGDETQDFFLTESQNDWSGGEDRAYRRSSDPDSLNRYWFGRSVVIENPGEVSMEFPTVRATLPGGATGVWAGGAPPALTGVPIWASDAHLYTLTGSTYTDRGAHGLGTGPTCSTFDSDTLYFSSEVAGTVGVRQSTTAFAYATFSATACGGLAFVNNILYGVSANLLVSFSTAGAPTTLFTWKDARGNAVLPDTLVTMLAYGNKIYIVFTSEIWMYDGTNTTRVADLGVDFTATDACVSRGAMYIIGFLGKTNSYTKETLLTYNGSTVDHIWSTKTPTNIFVSNSRACVCPYSSGVAFLDIHQGFLRAYNDESGAIRTLGITAYSTLAGILGSAVRGSKIAMVTPTGTDADSYPATAKTTSYIETCLIDFDSSLVKYLRGVKVEWESGSVGDGATVDIAFCKDSLNQSFNTLQNTALSGVEYLFAAGTSAHSVSIKVTLNKGASANGPKIKRIYVRAAPILQSYRANDYLLDLTGNKRADPPLYLTLADGSTHSKDGEEMRADLQTAIAAGPITITDRFGTFTGVIEPGSSLFKEVRADYGRAEYRAEISVREI